MNKRVELNEDMMAQVNGGFSGHVGQYNGVIGESYYLVYDESYYDKWYYGELIDSYEKDYYFWTRRKHVFMIYSENGKECKVPYTMEVFGSDYSMFKEK